MWGGLYGGFIIQGQMIKLLEEKWTASTKSQILTVSIQSKIRICFRALSKVGEERQLKISSNLVFELGIFFLKAKNKEANLIIVM